MIRSRGRVTCVVRQLGFGAHLDDGGKLGKETDEERVGFEGGHVDPARAALGALDDDVADCLHFGRQLGAAVGGELREREGEVLVCDAHLRPLGLRRGAEERGWVQRRRGCRVSRVTVFDRAPCAIRVSSARRTPPAQCDPPWHTRTAHLAVRQNLLHVVTWRLHDVT